MRSTVSSKGQITIPVQLREELGLQAGTPVVFERHPGGALLRKGTVGHHPVDRAFGRLRLNTSVDVILDEMRGRRARGRRPRRRRT